MQVLVSRALFLSAAGLVSACGGAPDDPEPAEEPQSSADEAVAEPAGDGGGTRRGERGGGAPLAELLEAEPFDSEQLGALHGEIRFAGDARERYLIGAEQKSECTTHADVDHLSDTVVVADGRVKFVFVTIRSGYDESAVPAPPEDPVVLNQHGCVYTPHVLGIQAGRRLEVANDDPTNHNVNFSAPRNSLSGNRNMGKGQEPLDFDFTRAETSIRFKCDIHPWMLSWVHVQEHPWFAVSDDRGEFRIPNVPPGEYTVEAIHERFKRVRRRVTVEAGRSTGFAITLLPN